MKTKKLLFLIAVLTLTITAVHGQTIRYVKAGATGNGSSWENASGDLQLMINQSDYGDEVWVAAGTYTPYYRPDMIMPRPFDRFCTFALKNGVKVYGGFPVFGSPTMANRNWISYKTTLSGDIGVPGNANDNVFHVVWAYDLPHIKSHVFLDGFEITGGNANSPKEPNIEPLNLAKEYGGGIALHNVTATLSNLSVHNNYAMNNGGGLYAYNSSVQIINSSFRVNTSNKDGGGIFLSLTSQSSSSSYKNIKIINSLISENTAGWGGGGIYSFSDMDSEINIINTTISRNTANSNWPDKGDGIYSRSQKLKTKIYNSIILGNGTNALTPEVQIHNSLIESRTDTQNGNINATNVRAEDIFVQPYSSPGNYQLKNNNKVIDKGSNIHYDPRVYGGKDLNYSTRYFGSSIDLGAYEFAPDITPTSNILYVSKGFLVSGNGSSWANPVRELADALRWAKQNAHRWTATNPLQIWVTGDSHKPLYSPEDNYFGIPDGRNNAFLMVNNVQLLGGFDGVETNIFQRRNDIIRTSMNGDLGVENDISDNAHHVVIAIGSRNSPITRNLLIDRFIITGGNADSQESIMVNQYVISQNTGGGMVNINASLKVHDSYITKNDANDGGGVFNINSSPLFLNTVIRNNYSRLYGGGMLNKNYSNPLIVNTAIYGNKAEYRGAAMYNSSSNPTFINTTISGNRSPLGAIANENLSSNKIYNSIILGNSFTGISSEGTNAVYYYNSLIQNYTSTENNNISSQGITASDIFTAPASPERSSNGDYTLSISSIAVNKGSDNYYGGGTYGGQDLNRKPRWIGGSIDLGAYESQEYIVDYTIYVNHSATGQNNGNSWANAFKTLADAMVWAKQNESKWTSDKPLKIWVASGTYKPMYTPADTIFGRPDGRNNAFRMVSNVKIYGGFNGTETQFEQRNWRTNETILSGDLGVIGDSSDNAYHVVVTVGTTDKDINTFSVLDGFTITGGRADNLQGFIYINRNKVSQNSGGGIYSQRSISQIINCNITDNWAYHGGGMIALSSSNNLVTSKINANTATWGGGIYHSDASSFISNSLISGNTASNSAGGIFTQNNSAPLIVNTTITGNYAPLGAAMFVIQSATPKVYNSIILGNQNGISNQSGYVDIQNSLVQGLSSTDNENLDATGVTADDIFTAPVNPGLNSGGDYSLKNNSFVIDKGSGVFYNSAMYGSTDLAGNPRTKGANLDLGAYELQVTSSNNNIVFIKNESSGTGDGSSWSNASSQLGEVLKWAKQNENQWTAENPLQIWVTAGLHNPASSPADGSNGIDEGKYNTFLLPRNVQLYGGFSGSETQLSERNWLVNKTILSGDIGVPGDNSDNVYNVVMSVGTPTNPITPATVLDGFIITGGNANNSGSTIINEQTVYRNTGAGMLNLHSSPTIRNTVFIDNAASGTGGGVYNFSSSPVMSNVLICENTAYNGAGMTNRVSSSPILTNITISGNTAYNQGGGMENYNSSNPKIRNSIIFGNSSGISSVSGSVPAIQYSLVQELSDASNGNLDATNVTVDDVFSFTSASPSPSSPSRVKSAANDYTLSSGSIAIDRGNNADYNTALLGDKDLAGNTRIIGDFIDLGAFEYQTSTDISSPIEHGGIIKVYPNPVTDGMLYITIDKDTEATLYDGGGNAVKKISLNPGTNNMNIRDVPAGLYLLRTETGKGIKVIIK